MAGSAILGANLVDRLAPLADRMRALEDRLGLRQYAVSRVHRRWTGARRLDGDPIYLLDELIDPTPEVRLSPSGLEYRPAPGSRMEEGQLELHQVSLTYTEEELRGPALDVTDEWFYRIVDKRGQLWQARRFVLASPPVPDRVREMGWILRLSRVDLDEELSA